MGKFTKNYLKNAEKSGEKLGNWQGWPVYASSNQKYRETGSKALVMYEDDNKIVYNGKCYGYLNVNGDINNCNPYSYCPPVVVAAKKEKEVMRTPASGEYSEAVASHEFFAQLDAQINKLLAEAKEWNANG